MKKSVNAKTKGGATRDLFAELGEGLEALAEARARKRTLRTHAVEHKWTSNLTPQEPIRIRKS